MKVCSKVKDNCTQMERHCFSGCIWFTQPFPCRINSKSHSVLMRGDFWTGDVEAIQNLLTKLLNWSGYHAEYYTVLVM